MIEEVPDLPKDDELPDYGNNCETWAIAVDTNPTMVLTQMGKKSPTSKRSVGGG